MPVRDFAIRHPYRDDHAAALERLAVHVRFVLSQPTAEHALPQAGLPQPGPILIEHADVVGMETTRLQGVDSGLGMRDSVESCNNGLAVTTIPLVRLTRLGASLKPLCAAGGSPEGV